jgi:hypothetical protein
MNTTVIAAILSVVLFSGGVVTGIKWEAGVVAKRDVAAKDARDEALAAAAREIAKIDVKRVTIRQPLEKQVYEKVVYRDCRHDADGLHLLNQALSNGSTGSGKLPGNAGPTPER